MKNGWKQTHRRVAGVSLEAIRGGWAWRDEDGANIAVFEQDESTRSWVYHPRDGKLAPHLQRGYSTLKAAVITAKLDRARGTT
jgi:hypothetical protein